MSRHAAKIGEKLVLQENSPSGEYALVFEDDGDTGYLYALTPDGVGGLDLLDALHIYNAEDSLRGTDISLQLLWRADSRCAGLRVNASLWAVFDFAAQKGWTRSEFPPPQGRWKGGEREPWNPELINLF